MNLYINVGIVNFLCIRRLRWIVPQCVGVTWRGSCKCKSCMGLQICISKHPLKLFPMSIEQPKKKMKCTWPGLAMDWTTRGNNQRYSRMSEMNQDGEAFCRQACMHMLARLTSIDTKFSSIITSSCSEPSPQRSPHCPTHCRARRSGMRPA